MAITASDIVTDDDVKAIVEKTRNKYYQFRSLFREDDATGINSDSRSFPQTDFEFEDEFVEIPEGAEYPRASKNYNEVKAAYTKYGLEVPISDEAVSDSAINLEMDVNEDLIEAEEQRLDAIAFNVLASNYDNAGSEIGDGTGDITYANIAQARQDLWNNDADITDIRMVVSGLNVKNLITMNEFTQASELGDQTVTQGILPGGDLANQGFLGTAGDVPVYAENVGLLGQGEAFVVDTGDYGWESTRWDRDVSSYREEENDQDVWKIRGRWDWVTTDTSKAVKIVG